MYSTHKHSLIALAALAAFALAPAVALAQPKIGFVNTARLLEESPQARAAQTALEGEFLPRQRELANQQKALQDKEEKLKRDSAVMSEADRAKAERELRDGQRDLARRFSELQEDANLRRNEEFGKVQRSLLQEVQTYARANGFDLVVSDGVLFASPAVDITAQVVAVLKTKGPAAPAAAPRN
ncbi:MAG: OmpH family outer membrane protein [Steroidobacteraceae bacterium]|jgi:outer membrane protein|nr:OmpH family outer membrane protein [Steroidobacteraceae bacterium]